MIQAPAFVQAQDTHEPELNLLIIGTVVRMDQVGPDLFTLAARKSTEVFDRKVTVGENGAYALTITDAQGNIRMEGQHSNTDLTLPEGEYTYYYPNGQIECKGMYKNNVKYGTWMRYAMDGTLKAERNYSGQTWEEMDSTIAMAH